MQRHGAELTFRESAAAAGGGPGHPLAAIGSHVPARRAARGRQRAPTSPAPAPPIPLRAPQLPQEPQRQVQVGAGRPVGSCLRFWSVCRRCRRRRHSRGTQRQVGAAAAAWRQGGRACKQPHLMVLPRAAHLPAAMLQPHFAAGVRRVPRRRFPPTNRSRHVPPPRLAPCLQAGRGAGAWRLWPGAAAWELRPAGAAPKTSTLLRCRMTAAAAAALLLRELWVAAMLVTHGGACSGSRCWSLCVHPLPARLLSFPPSPRICLGPRQSTLLPSRSLPALPTCLLALLAGWLACSRPVSPPRCLSSPPSSPFLPPAGLPGPGYPYRAARGHQAAQPGPHTGGLAAGGCCSVWWACVVLRGRGHVLRGPPARLRLAMVLPSLGRTPGDVGAVRGGGGCRLRWGSVWASGEWAQWDVCVCVCVCSARGMVQVCVRAPSACHDCGAGWRGGCGGCRLAGWLAGWLAGRRLPQLPPFALSWHQAARPSPPPPPPPPCPPRGVLRVCPAFHPHTFHLSFPPPQGIMNEVELLRALRHRNIVTYIGGPRVLGWPASHPAVGSLGRVAAVPCCGEGGLRRSAGRAPAAPARWAGWAGARVCRRPRGPPSPPECGNSVVIGYGCVVPCGTSNTLRTWYRRILQVQDPPVHHPGVHGERGAEVRGGIPPWIPPALSSLSSHASWAAGPAFRWPVGLVAGPGRPARQGLPLRWHTLHAPAGREPAGQPGSSVPFTLHITHTAMHTRTHTPRLCAPAPPIYYH